MKTPFVKPCFEFVFCVGLIAILGLPPVLMAQTHKDLDIKIENGDTVINGKNIKLLSPAEKQSALSDISHIGAIKDNPPNMYKDTAGNARPYRFRNDHHTLITESTVLRDSAGNVISMKTRKNNPPPARRNRMDDGRPNPPGMRYGGKNTQSFDYVDVDNEGITTRVTYHISEVSNDDLKKMPYVEGPKFEVKDLNLVPEFSTGKTLLMFNLLSKTAASVQLTDSEGKLVWSEKALGGSFKKTFPLGLNGVYYLQIKQGNSIALKRIMKME